MSARIYQFDMEEMKKKSEEILHLEGSQQDFDQKLIELYLVDGRGLVECHENDPASTVFFVDIRSRYFQLISLRQSLPVPIYVKSEFPGKEQFSNEFHEYRSVLSKFVRNMLSNPCCPREILFHDDLLRSPFWKVIATHPSIALYVIENDPTFVHSMVEGWYKQKLLPDDLGHGHSLLSWIAAPADMQPRSMGPTTGVRYLWNQPAFADDRLLNWLEENLSLLGTPATLPRPEMPQRIRLKQTYTNASISRWLSKLDVISESARGFLLTTLKFIRRKLTSTSYQRGREEVLSWNTYSEALLIEMVEKWQLRGLFLFIDRAKVLANLLDRPFPRHLLSDFLEEVVEEDPSEILIRVQ